MSYNNTISSTTTKKRYGNKLIDILTRPFSRRVKLYDSGWKNPPTIDFTAAKKKREKNEKDERRYQDIMSGRTNVFH